MNLKELHEQHSGHASDKWELYLTKYDALFAPYRKKPVALLEIGVQNGGSLEIYAEYFSQARHIVGCDINPECGKLSFANPAIRVIVGDASTEKTKRNIINTTQTYDIIIDDGSHKSSDIIQSFLHLFPLVSIGGIYIIEDLHASYWNEYEGGLFNPYSSQSFCKQLIDIVNHEHWDLSSNPAEAYSYILAHYGITTDLVHAELIHSVEFVNSMCIIHKNNVQANKLGPERVCGRVGLIEPSRLLYNNAECTPSVQVNSLWNNPVATQLQQLKQTCILLTEQVADASTKLERIVTSKSWRLTAPLRALGDLIKRLWMAVAPK